MKDLFRILTGRNLYLLLTAAGLFAIAFVIKRYVIGTTSAHYYSRLIERNIQNKEDDFQKLTSDTALLQALVDQSYSEETLSGVVEDSRGYAFFIYEKLGESEPQLKFWNTQHVLPPINFLDESDASRIVRLSNGLYVNISKSVTLPDGKTYSIEGLIPVMYRYFVEIENLSKEFAEFPDAGKRVNITFNPTDYEITSSFGNVLFYLEKTRAQNQKTSLPSILIILAGFFFLFLYIHQAADFIAERYKLWIATWFLAAVIVVLRWITYSFPQLLNLRQFELFDPAIYSSSFLLSSLGDLLINSILFCWLAMFVFRRLPNHTIEPWKSRWMNWASVILALTALVGSTFIFAGILQSLVADAQISFNVINFFSLSQYSFIGFAVLAIITLSYFFLSQIVLRLVKTMFSQPDFYVLILSALIGLIILTFTSDSDVLELNLYALLWLLAYLFVMRLQIFSNFSFRLNVSEVLFWLFVYSFSIAAVIISENRKIEVEQRKRFAEKLSFKADPSSERLLSIALTYLDQDFLSENFDRFKESDENELLKDSIINTNFTAYLNKYDTEIFTFDASQTPLHNESAVSYDTLNTIFQIQGKPTTIPDLRYFEKTYDKVSYIAKREVKDSSGFNVGYFFMLSEPKRYKSDALIPELFKQSRELVPEYSQTYSYAVYNGYELIEHYNDYPFPTHLDPGTLPKGEFHFVQKKENEELWYRHSADKIVVIAKKNSSFIEAITLFAYLFTTFLFLLAAYRITALLIRSRLRWDFVKQYWELSIRSQIHSTIILVSLLSFVIIGIATILFFVNRYERNNQDRLTRAIQIMVNEVKSKLTDHQMFNDGLFLFDTVASAEVERLMHDISEVHGTDVNLYDTMGTQRFSSNPFIYNKGVLSEKMNPVAYHKLHNQRAVQVVAEEKMGKVDYISVYVPVRDNEGDAYAYLNIPSYSTQGELKQEISNFLVTIINLNAFIFLVAGAIALFITNRITSSFTIIGQKMRDINLMKSNQVIEWKRNDEIGELVKEYNKMVLKLDESAEALAKSEREGAWRQMAKQVAHEIKNPLTPMKLSIQYLQKAIDNNSPDVKEMTANVARTLIEQIDHLSKIASDFSQFANIGNPRNEVFDLHEMLNSLTSLYEPTENLDFKWEPVPQKVMLYADKTQLNRLFTNLMQNAIESQENKLDRVIRIREQLNGEYITISIEDNGEGIPLQMREKIFTPNFTTKSSGTGLGLAMSKSIAEQAQGDIWFESRDGEGTTFHVKLPLLRATG